MNISFDQQFDQHDAWRHGFAERLRWLERWLREHDLLDSAVAERLSELDAKLRTSKLSVAFVAEFSRGKSELINAIFFANYGRRIMPASAGRTTMCPTELGYDDGIAPSLRLLPIETRLEAHSIAHWRETPERWTEIAIDVNDGKKLAEIMSKVSEVRRVTQDEARTLGFWSESDTEDNPMPDADGRIEVPRWRHALVNMPHPLLQQGLVILDTPGLNAIGAEPELTVNLIPQAHAVVFILGADTGVTRSDLEIWREHLVTEGDPGKSRLVVLNKIDTLWDTLSTPAQIEAQLARQCRTSAELLGMPLSQVMPVSAQKGLQAKITGDPILLASSRLAELETALGEGILGKRESMLRQTVNAGITSLRGEAVRILNVRRRDLSEQALELSSLRGKNTSVIKHMRTRIENERGEFEGSRARIVALRSIQAKLLREVYAVLGQTALKDDMERFASALKRPGIKLNARSIYAETFEALRGNLREVQKTTAEIQAMLHATYRQLNAEFGFTLLATAEPSLKEYEDQLTGIERGHVQYLGVGNLIKLAQPDFCDKLVRALNSRLRSVNDAVMGEVETWSQAAAAQLETQVKERRRNFNRRIEAVERIQAAAGGLDQRLQELAEQEQRLEETQQRLIEVTLQLSGDEKVEVASEPVEVSLA